jgi:hypothetical protein
MKKRILRQKTHELRRDNGNMQELCDSFKRPTCKLWASKKRSRQRYMKYIQKINSRKKFPNLKKEMPI